MTINTCVRDASAKRRTLFLCASALFFLTATLPVLAVPVISNNTTAFASLTSGAPSFSFIHTTNPGAFRLLLVSVSMNVQSNTTSTISGVTYNGATLTFVGGQTSGNATNKRRVEFWRLVNPPIGTYTLAITANNIATASVGVVATATGFNGVNNTTPLGTAAFATGTNATPSVNVTSATNDLVVDRVAIAGNGGTINPGANQTQFVAATNSGTSPTDVTGASSYEAGAATVTMSEAITSQRWEIGGVAVKPTATIADLVTTVSTFSPDPVQLNTATTATFTITNNGPQAATGATFTIALPGIVTSPVATPSSGSCTGSGPVTCTFPTIASGNSVTVALSVTAIAAGTISITGTADDTVEFDPPANSSATVTAKAQNPCATPGKDGAGGTLTGVVNAYYPGTSATSTSITVGAGNAAGANTNIAAGDLLLVIQMQDATISSSNTSSYGSGVAANGGAGYTALNNAGIYEFVVATSGITFGTGGTVNITGGGPGGTLMNTYTNAAAAGGNGAKRFQVVRVPQYSSATLSSGLTAAPWNGTSGGILALDVAGVLNLGGTVSVDGKGFRGGGGRALNGATGGSSTDYVRGASFNANGNKGEGIAGTPQYVYNGALLNTTIDGYPSGSEARGAPADAGGGGTDGDPAGNTENSGGGGGGNGGAGGHGGNTWNSNLAIGGVGGVALPAAQTRLFLGGGGGAGTTNNGTSDPNTNTTGLNSSGAIGGGIVIIRAAEIAGTGTITANGANALNVAQDGGGGGGAGGTIMVLAKTGTFTGLNLAAKGGNGGSTWLAQAAGTCPGANCNYHGPGGGGGGGVILTSSAPASTDVSGGANGVTSQALNAFNSTAGSAGVTSSSATFNVIPGLDSGAECAPDLSSTKSGNGPWIRGKAFSYSLGVSNIGIQDTSGVVTLTDTLPAGMVPLSASGTGWLCSVALQTVACNRSDALSDGQSYSSVTINGTVGQTTPDSITNTATVSGGSEFYAGNDSASNSSTASSIADVYVLSSDSPDPVAPGGTVTYTQTVANLGPSDAGNAAFSTTVPSNAGFTSIAVPSGWSCSVPPIGSSGTVNCVTNYLVAGTSASFVMVTTLKSGVTSGMTLTNVATASSIAADPNLINNTTVTVTAVGASPADVTLTNVSSPTALAAGSNITFTHVVRNQGGSTATGVTFTETIPSNTTFQSFSDPTCTYPVVGGTGTVSCTIGNLAAGATLTYTTVVQANGAAAPGTVISDTGTVAAANDSVTSNNSATATAVVTLASQSDLVVGNVASSPQVFAGNNVSFVQTIANNGPAAATNVVVNEIVPAGTAFVSVTPPPGWSCTAPVSGAFTCSATTLAVGASATIMLDVAVPSSAALNSTISNSVSASSSNGDPNSSNNTAVASTSVLNGANLVVANTYASGNDPAKIGDTYTLAQTVTNLGPSDSGTIALIETIPSNVTVGTITKPAGWSCGAQVGATITCTGPSLAPGAAALNFSIPLTVTAGPTGTLLAESVQAIPTVSEMIPADNVASYTNAVSSGSDADFAVTAVATTDPVVAGQNLTYTATITNKGPAMATSVTFTLQVPTNTTFVSLTAPVSCTTPSVGGTGTITCTATNIPSGTSGTVVLVAKVNSSAADGSTIQTMATVSSTPSDPNSSNNSATTNTQVIRESDLSITNSDSPDPLNTTASSLITYTQVITNNGPSDAANVIVTETVPAGVSFGSVTSKPAGWNCTAPSGGVFTCTGPSLAAGANGTIVFTATATVTSGILIQTASVSSDSLDLNAANNTASASTTVATGTQSDLQITVTSGSSTVSAGNNLTFTDVVTNRGPAISTTPVTVTIPIPPNSNFQGLTFPGTGWSCPLPAVGSTGTITCTSTANLAVNATATFALTVQVNGSTPANTVIGETASVSGPISDPDSTNNSATDSSRVTNPVNADTSVTLTANPTSVKTGNSFTLTAVVSNAGPASATGTTFTLPITSAEQFVSVSSTQGSCIFAGGSVVCSLGTIANAGSATITIVGNAIALGTTTNVATVQSNENDATPGNNTASVDLTFSSPTSVLMVSFTATNNGARVVLDWRTREEVRNLGFNVYREVDGQRTKLNNSLIAGSAVRTQVSLTQHSASAYRWIDEAPVAGATYLVEDVSVTGVRMWNGPVSVTGTATELAARATSATLADISRSASAASIPFNPMPLAGTETTINSVPGWIADASNPSRPGRVQPPARVESAWLAGRSAAKIAVDHLGWYRVTQAELNAAGFDTNIDLSTFHLYAEGFDVPIRMSSTANGMSFEFYATGLDTQYTGTRIYWLTAGTGPGRRIPVTTPDNQMPIATSYLATVEKRDRSFYFAALTNNGDQDNFFGDVIAGGPVDQHLTVSNIDISGGTTARIFVEVQGITDLATHDVQVSVNGFGVGDIAFTGMLNRSLSVDVPLSVLVEGDNVVSLAPLAGDDDVTAVDRIQITYPRSFAAVQDQLKFVVPGRTTVNLTGFSAPARVFQLDTASLVTTKFAQQKDATYTGALTNPDTAPRTYYAFTDAMVQQSSAVTKNDVSNLSSPSNAADLLIVSHRDFMSSLAPLVAARQQQGYTTSVVNIEDLYDEFNYGENSPQALRNLLTTATTKWHKAPKWLLLVGDASVDPRNFLGQGSFDFVPTKLVATAQMKTADDGWFADFSETGLPQIATGRIPVRTAAEANAVVAKLVGYDQQALGTWSSQALLVTDQNIGTDFSAETAQIGTLLPSSLEQTVINFATAGAGTIRAQLLAQLNAGQLFVNYIGHGSVDVWAGSGILTGDDAANLTNGGHLPLVVTMDCLNGFFHDVYQTSMAESLLLAPNGGAAAVWASSGLTEPESQFVMDQNLVQYLFANPSITIGEATTQARSGVNDVDVRRTWNLFGDPSMKLRTGGN